MTAFNSTVDAHLRQTQVPLQAALGPHANSVSLILCNDCELRCAFQPFAHGRMGTKDARLMG